MSSVAVIPRTNTSHHLLYFNVSLQKPWPLAVSPGWLELLTLLRDMDTRQVTKYRITNHAHTVFETTPIVGDQRKQWKRELDSLDFIQISLSFIKRLGFKTCPIELDLMSGCLYINAQKLVLGVPLSRHFSYSFRDRTLSLIVSFEGPTVDFVKSGSTHEALLVARFSPRTESTPAWRVEQDFHMFLDESHTGESNSFDNCLKVLLARLHRVPSKMLSISCRGLSIDSSFLGLPLEIRGEIYEHVLDMSSMIIDTIGILGDASQNVQFFMPTQANHLGLRLVNQQISNEFHLYICRYVQSHSPILFLSENTRIDLESLCRRFRPTKIALISEGFSPANAKVKFVKAHDELTAFISASPHAPILDVTIIEACRDLSRDDWEQTLAIDGVKISVSVLRCYRFSHRDGSGNVRFESTNYRRTLRDCPNGSCDTVSRVDDPISLINAITYEHPVQSDLVIKTIVEAALLRPLDTPVFPDLSNSEIEILEQILPKTSWASYEVILPSQQDTARGYRRWTFQSWLYQAPERRSGLPQRHTTYNCRF